MIKATYTADQVRAYRDQNECSMMEAKSVLHKNMILDLIAEVRLTGDMKLLIDIVEELVNRTRFG